MLLRVHVASLDLLGELDLLRCGQQRVPAGLAQEQLERIRRRLDDDRWRWRRCNFLLLDVVDDFDSARLELAVQEVDLEHVEIVRVDQLVELGLADAVLRGRFEQRRNVLVLEDGLDFDRH